MVTAANAKKVHKPAPYCGGTCDIMIYIRVCCHRATYEDVILVLIVQFLVIAYLILLQYKGGVCWCLNYSVPVNMVLPSSSLQCMSNLIKLFKSGLSLVLSEPPSYFTKSNKITTSGDYK